MATNIESPVHSSNAAQAFLATRGGPSTSAPSNGSRTMTMLDNQPREEGDENAGDVEGSVDDHVLGVLRLRGGPRGQPRVAWTDDVIDNEGMGKKKSKICCIYHKPKRFDESSSSDDSSDSEADSDSDDHCRHHSHRHPQRRPQRRRGSSSSDETSSISSNAAASQERRSGGVVDESEKNAYERQPASTNGRIDKGKGKEGGGGDRA